jgi:hypothetical protein
VLLTSVTLMRLPPDVAAFFVAIVPLTFDLRPSTFDL